MTSLTTYLLVFVTAGSVFHPQPSTPPTSATSILTSSQITEPPARKDTAGVGLFAHQPRPVAVRTLCCRKQNPVASLPVLETCKTTFQLNLPVLFPSEVRIANWICCTFGVTSCQGHWLCFRFRSSQGCWHVCFVFQHLQGFELRFRKTPANNQLTRLKNQVNPLRRVNSLLGQTGMSWNLLTIVGPVRKHTKDFWLTGTCKLCEFGKEFRPRCNECEQQTTVC